MPGSKEPIKRLFYPCEEAIPTDADGLLTASEELRKYANLIILDEFATLPGAILLGEGGMGKSTVMQQLHSCFPKGRSHVIELGLFSGNAPGIDATIEFCFDVSRSTPDAGFAILFDGLDEAPELAGPILLKIRELPNRATVWISSRDVPAIRAIQSEAPQLRSYMIAPLSLADIVDLARRSNINPEQFVESIGRGGITSICAKPIGCDLAMSVFQENALVDVKQVDLWHKGITRLCDETGSATRRIVSKTRSTLEDVVNCCSWMALCLTLSGKTAIWNDEESHCPDNCANLSDIQSSVFSPDLIAASLSRGVFTPSGDGRFRFSHATYRDYLTSLGFERFIPATHWTSLLFTRIKTGVLPQREGVATWLAARNSGFLDEISGIEPEILLSSVDAIQAIGPTALCKALLDRSDAISYQQRHNSVVAKNLFRLSSAGTCHVIRDRLIDQNAGDSEIDFAIEIAKACQCTDLAYILVDRVLDQDLPYHHRVAASHAVLSLDNISAKGRLKTLLPLDSVEDPFDDLRGNVLRCCWPDHLTVDELLENLSPPQRSNYLGAYGMFLDYEFPASFKEIVDEEAACKLLTWSTDHIARDQIIDRVGRLAGRIYSYCWQWATVPAVSTLLATGYFRALKLYRTPFAEDKGLLRWRKEPALPREEFVRDRGKRFAVLEALLKTDVEEQTLIYVPINEYPLFGPDDAGQLLEQALSDTSSPLAAKWILCFKALAGRVNPGELSQQIDKLHLARPDLIDSAFEMREHAENHARYSLEMNQKWKQQEEETKRKRESDQQKIDLGIKSVLSQKAPAAELFVEIAIWIHSEDGMTSLGSIDVTASPGWKKLSAVEQQSLITLAERYLREGRIEQTAPEQLTFSVAQAFWLLRLVKPDIYLSLPEEIWDRSAVELLKPAFSEYMEFLDPLFNTLAENFPNTAETALIQIIRQQLTVGHISILRHWGKRLSEKQSHAIMCLAKDTLLKAEERYAILSALVECGRKDAVTTYIESFLSNEWNPHPDKSLNGHLLLAFSLSPGVHAPQIVRAMESDREWGRQLIEFAVMDMGFGRSLASCSPAAIASTYKWLHTEYPLATRPDREGGFAGPLDMIHDLKDYLIRHLSQSGIEGTSTALESIGLAFPSDRWLHDLILDARRNEEAAKLPTLSFAVIKKLREDNSVSRRMINSIGDLHEIVCEKLIEYQSNLSGDTPAVGDLWDVGVAIHSKNKAAIQKARPKSEESFSDHLCRYLKITISPSLVINREVIIRRKQYANGTPGSRTDLWIQAIPERGQILTLCIEVKCNWNETAKSALQDQLIDKYMSGGTADAGILVLGWYACPDWDPTDGRLLQSTKTWLDLNSAQADLDGQCTQLQKGKHYVSAKVIDCSLL